jgi:thiol:disulfide interchange protein DsbD
METVKKFFGVLLLAVAIWIVSPVLPEQLVMLLWAALAIGAAMFLRALDRLPHRAPGYARLGKAFGVLALVWGIALAIGAASGSRDPLEPLAGLRAGVPAADAHVKFERVRSVSELETRLASATKPVMLDFYADWCVSCKEMERYTFADEKVRARLSEMTLLQVDVTANSDDDKALLKRFKLFGPPGIVFFDRDGREIQGLRVIGYQPADRFLKTLELAVPAT